MLSFFIPFTWFISGVLFVCMLLSKSSQNGEPSPDEFFVMGYLFITIIAIIITFNSPLVQ